MLTQLFSCVGAALQVLVFLFYDNALVKKEGGSRRGKEKKRGGKGCAGGRERGGGGELGQLWFVPIFGLQECIGQERGGKLGGRGKEGGMKREVGGWREIGATVAFLLFWACRNALVKKRGGKLEGENAERGGIGGELGLLWFLEEHATR